ncbi:MAG: histidine kinase [Ilumatobacteraceae bacterium]
MAGMPQAALSVDEPPKGNSRRWRAIAICAIAVDIVVGFLALRQQFKLHRSSAFLVSEFIGGAAMGVAAVAIWRRRPENRCWWLLLAASVAWWIGNFEHHSNREVALFGFSFGRWQDVFLAAAVLMYPNGKTRHLADRVVIWTLVALTGARTLSRLFLFVPADVAGYGTRNRFLEITDDRWWRAVEDWHARGLTIVIVVMLGIVVHRWFTSGRTTRHMLTPALIAAAVLAICVVYRYQVGWSTRIGPSGDLSIEYIVRWAYGGLALALAIGMVRLRRTRSAVVDVFAELHDGAPPDRLENALGRALGDQSLTLLPWSDAADSYVDKSGQPIDISVERPGRAVTLIQQVGAPVAALLHDAALLEDPGLVNAVVGAVRLTIDNEKLQTELEAQLIEVAASRSRIVAAGDAARRRIERDLHDGAQQRLVSAAVGLRLASDRLADSPDPRVHEVLEAAATELQATIQELRNLAHGIHPSVLTEFGLGAALESLANRSTLDVRLSLALGHEPEQVIAATAYFAVAEALTNAMKHANAKTVTISATSDDQSLRVEIEDDGNGGADITRGTGMAGIADRIATVGGTMSVDSPLGAGTRLLIGLPCASS